MTGELGYVSHIVLDRQTICGNRPVVELVGNRTGLMTLPKLVGGEPDRGSIVARSTTVRAPSMVDFEDQDLARTVLAICHNAEDRMVREPTVEKINENPARTQEEAMQEAAERWGRSQGGYIPIQAGLHC
jgi:hypothetical protein